jgi:Tfp pilus assembly protein PilO
VKGSDKAVVLGVVVAIVLAGFYLKVLSPKREKAASLSKEITELQAKVDQQKQAADFAEEARRNFPTYYGRLVVLGKAVPADSDTSSLLVQVNTVANRTGVDFNGLQLSASSSDTSTASPAAAASSTASTAATSSSASGTDTTGTSTTGDSSTPPTTSSSTSTAGATTPMAATEATAANLPIGASVGSAGLPTMPYDLTFEGSYFQVANFLKGVDDLVHLRGSAQVAADGRLLTINGFALKPAEAATPDTSAPNAGTNNLLVTLAVTSYVTPGTQGLTAGATPGGPAPSVSQPQAQPTSAAVTP